MKNLIVIGLIILFSSCLTVKRIEKNCDKFLKVCSVEQKIITKYRDTTIYVDKPIYIDKIIEVPVPSKDSVRIRDSVRIVNNYAYLEPVHKEVGIIGVDASIYRSRISIDAYLTDSTVLYNYRDTLSYKDSITIYNAIKETVTDNTIALPPIKYIPGFYKFTFWIFIGAIVAFIIWVLIKLSILKIPKLW